MNDKPDYVTVSFSGGKDSTAMVLHMIELGEHIDEVINLDTGQEFPDMYVHIEKVKKVIEDAGIKYTSLRDSHTFEYYLYDIEVNSKKYGHIRGYGWPTSQIRWCTSKIEANDPNHTRPKYRTNYTVKELTKKFERKDKARRCQSSLLEFDRLILPQNITIPDTPKKMESVSVGYRSENGKLDRGDAEH